MLSQLLSVVKQVHVEAAGIWGKGVRGSDDLMPLMVYSTLHAANVTQPYASLAFLDAFEVQYSTHGSRAAGECGGCCQR